VMFREFRPVDYLPVPSRLLSEIKFGKEKLGIMKLGYFDYSVRGNNEQKEYPVGVMRVRMFANLEQHPDNKNPLMVFDMRPEMAGATCQCCSNRHGRSVLLEESGCTRTKCHFNSQQERGGAHAGRGRRNRRK